MAASTNKAKMRQSKTRAARYVAQAARTQRNKIRQKGARQKKAEKRIGQSAQKRKDRRAFVANKRLTDKDYARKLPPPDPKITHETKNTDTRGVSQLIYSCTLTPYRD